MTFQLGIRGIGIWTHGIQSWAAFREAAQHDYQGISSEFENPAPGAIPARERRRAPLLVRLAVEVMHQACDMARVDKRDIATVFASAMGDSEITLYMCQLLAQREKLLSPTRFHNSVHNATSGYWSISTENRAPSSYVGGFQNSFAVALLEAAVRCRCDRRPVALAIYDIASQQPLTDLCPISETFGCALVLDNPTNTNNRWNIEISHGAGEAPGSANSDEFIRNRVNANPSAKGLPLLDALARNRRQEFRWVTGSGTQITVTPGVGE